MWRKLIFAIMLTTVFFSLIAFANAKYCHWYVEIYSSKEFSYEDIMFKRINYETDLVYESLTYCNDTLERLKINNSISTLNNWKIGVMPIRPLEESGCDFLANTTNGVTIRIDADRLIGVMAPIEGCYDKMPPYSESWGEAFKVLRAMPRDWKDSISFVRLDISEKNNYTDNDIELLFEKIQHSDYEPDYINVGGKEFFAKSEYYPYAERDSSVPLLMAIRGSPFTGSMSSAWKYPIMFFRISALNEVIYEKLIEVDRSLENDFNNITIIRNESLEIFQKNRDTKILKMG